MVKSVILLNNSMTETSNIELNNLETYVINKGYGNIKVLHTYISNEYEIIVYGWDSGSHSIINKHELPIPIDDKLYYGDLVIVLKCNGTFVDIELEDWEEFVYNSNEGFDDINSSSEEDEGEDEYDYEDGWLVREE